MMPMRICRDCQWHEPANHGCLHDRARQVDLVTGDEHRFSAFQMRTWPCGAEGKYWEAFPDPMSAGPHDNGEDPF